MKIMGAGRVKVVASGAEANVSLHQLPDGSFVAIDEFGNQTDVKAFCAAWFCYHTGNHMGEVMKEGELE